MSYILDALKKAELERNLGAIPTIHAQPVDAASASANSSVWRAPWIWIGLTAPVLGLGVLGALQSWQTPAAPPVAASVSPPPAPAVSTKRAPKPAPAAIAAAPEPSVTMTAPVVKASRPTPAKKAKADPVRNAAPSTAQQAPPADKKSASAALAASPRDELSAPTLRELPESIQREIPHFSVGGYLYSPNQADRTVLINKKLLREGEQVAPELTLEKMTPTGMIFNYKGYRYRTSY